MELLGGARAPPNPPLDPPLAAARVTLTWSDAEAETRQLAPRQSRVH